MTELLSMFDLEPAPNLNWGPADYEVAGDRVIKIGTTRCLEDAGLNLGS